ncbi:MAG: putative lipoprotein NlpE involved in copper resistance [Flavipsychrobacter sp.]|jgi:co-chaperonin GroES (HSP10)|nr:putative lipoprotein NlpE involved in copper resistance [Flavipsychrobacter sp.]
MVYPETYKILCVFAILLLATPANAQKKKKVTKPVIDTNAILSDKYSGTIMVQDDSVYTVLQLDHKMNTDHGAFMLDETYKKPDGRILRSQTPGKWEVLKGTIHDGEDNIIAENTNILQVDGSDKVLFFMWVDDSTIRKIDPQLKLIEPIDHYLLSRKAKYVPVKKDTLTPFEINMRKLAGRYVGKLPCADCIGITSTLSLRYSLHAKSGDYVLTDKYIGTKSGDITNDRKGRWNYISKSGGNNIVLDFDKKGRESYYLINKNGSLTPLDRNQQKINSPVDQTLRRQ